MAENDEDEAGLVWAEGIAREWTAEVADEREDLYTLEDGESIEQSTSSRGD